MQEIKVSAKKENLEKVRTFLHKILGEKNCDEKTLFNFDLVLEEIFVNIALYAYDKEGGEVTILCDIREGPRRVVVEFVDKGVEFNPLNKKKPNLGLEAEERKIGGLGIFLSKKLTDKIEYFRKNSENHLIFQKNF